MSVGSATCAGARGRDRKKPRPGTPSAPVRAGPVPNLRALRQDRERHYASCAFLVCARRAQPKALRAGKQREAAQPRPEINRPFQASA